MKTILLVVLTGFYVPNPTSMTTMEFEDEFSCKSAAVEILKGESFKNATSNVKVSAVCVPKLVLK